MRPIHIALMGSANRLFKKTINIGGNLAQVNLSALAIAAGYTQDKPAEIIFNVTNGSTLTAGLITGAWPAEELDITLNVIGAVYGSAGAGGVGGNGAAAGAPGMAGGDAISCSIPIKINVAPTGEIKGGGGGGGGGGGWANMVGPPGEEELVTGQGGDGGSGFPNQGVGGAAVDFAAGAGGPGGAAATAGGAGAIATSGGGATNYNPGAGGAAGWAIRKNGHVVPVTNNGVITGTQL